ncbi:MAG: DUF4350 domain-containing protein [Candidatus Dormibacteria bacterium]|jgi:hypothetical protein
MRRTTATPIAILVAVLALLVVAVIVAGPAASGDQDPSSTASGRAGTLALYDWVQAVGDSVHRIDSEFDLGGTDVLISAGPLDEFAYTAGDDAALTRFLEGGGEVILAIGSGISDPTAVEAVLQPLGIGAEASNLASASPSQPFPGSSGVSSVPLVAPGASAVGSVWTFSGGDGSLVPLLGAAQAPVVAAVRVGAGRLDLLGSEYPLSNDGLRRGDSAAFVLGLLQGARGQRVGFDEVHHLGPAGADDQGLTAVFEGPLLAAALLAVVVALLYLLTSGRRLGRPLPRRDPARVPSVLEHIEAVGHLLSRSRERGAVAGRYAEELKLRVGRATGVAPHLPDPDFVAALGGFGEERARAAGALLDQARRLAAGQPGEAELLGLARRVDALEAEWGVAAIR